MEGGRSYCRLCGELKALSTLVDVGRNPQEIIIKLSRINITADLKTTKLPKTVCEKCIIQLHKTTLFVQTIERGQRALSVIIQQINQDETDPYIIHTLNIDTESIKQESEQYHSELDNKEKVKVKFENEEEVSEEHASYSLLSVLSFEGDIPQEESSHSPLEKLRGSHIITTMMKTESEQDQIELNTEDLKCEVEEVNEENYILRNESLQNLLEKPQRLVMRKPVLITMVPAEYSNVSKTTQDDSEVENKKDSKENDTQPASTSSLEEGLRGEDLVKPDKCKSTADKSKISKLSSPWKDYIWLCSVCDTQFPTHDELKHHSMEVHSICNVLRCYECNAIRSTLPFFIRHVREHNEHLQHSCYKCHEGIHTRYQAGKHRLTHRLTKHICKGCHSSFNTPKELQDHISTYYRKINLKYTSDINACICNQCSKTFTTPMGLIQHLKLHTERKRDHTCEVCGKCFYTKQTLKGHMVTHNDERPFQCDLCKQKFKCHQHLRRHVKIHIAVERYSCDHCDRSFKFKWQIEMHLHIHTNSRPHTCSYCNKAFRFKSNLAQHMRHHTGVKPFSCSFCQRDFTFKGSYYAHMKRLHNMDIGKKKSNIDETANSENAKKYVDSILTSQKCVKQIISRPRFLKLEQKVIDYQLTKNGLES